jgi:hypothetical protein
MSRLSVLVAALCFSCNGASEFTWVYRACEAKTNECTKDLALFRSKEDCLDYDTYAGLRCMGGEALERAKDGEAVCWRQLTSVARGECRER